MAVLTEIELSINQRFMDVVDELKKLRIVDKEGELCDRIQVAQSNFSKYKKNDRAIPVDALVRMAKSYNVSTEWLLENKGNMFKSDENTLTEYTKRNDKRLDEQAIPLYDFEAAAGLTKLFSNAENILDFIRVPNLPKCDGAVHISGDSMYPLLKSGDIVMYRQVQDITNSILWGEMYLLSAEIGGDLLTLVKYIQRSDIGPDYIKLASQNQHHAPIDIPLKNVRALAYIKASIRINSMA